MRGPLNLRARQRCTCVSHARLQLRHGAVLPNLKMSLATAAKEPTAIPQDCAERFVDSRKGLVLKIRTDEAEP